VYGGTSCAAPCPGNGQCPASAPVPYCDVLTGGVTCMAN
jgi:hypothetical protein